MKCVAKQYFMEVLIDGDLASNNGGWQWSASTGVDPAPYFRIFNPYTQSQKVQTVLSLSSDALHRIFYQCDAGGEYIRTFVPELAKVKGAGTYPQATLRVRLFLTPPRPPTEIHKPPPGLADKLGYPRPLVNHDEARKRAIHRYKNIGEV